MSELSRFWIYKLKIQLLYMNYIETLRFNECKIKLKFFKYVCRGELYVKLKG